MRFARAAAMAFTIALLASPAGASAAEPRTSADAWIVIDGRDGKVLAGLDEHDTLAIASTTKMMTARIVLEELRSKRILVVPGYDASPAESVLGLSRGERVRVEDLLYALLLPSANDAANALAIRTSGSVRAFVERMNQEADALGLDDTSYATPIGLDGLRNGSSAFDLAKLAMVLREDPDFRRIVDTQTYTLESGSMPRTVTNRNTLLAAEPWVSGVKTGFTRDAGNVLVASASRGGVELISVVLGEPSESARDADSLALLEYGYSRYTKRRPLISSKPIAEAAVRYRDSDGLELLPAEDFSIRTRNDQSLETVVEAPAVVEGPIEAGDRIGRVSVEFEGRRVARVALVAGAAVEAPGFFDRHGVAVRNLGLLVLIGLVLIAVARYRKGRRRRERRERSRLSSERAAERAEELRADQ